MPRSKERQYGSWKSPVTSELIASGTIRFDSQIAASDDSIFWIESRPAEAGRYVVVGWHNGIASDVTPQPFNARTRVHEYGGGAFLVDDETVYFSNFADQRMYKHKPGSPPSPNTVHLTILMQFATRSHRVRDRLRGRSG